jgi:hypothetical protein
VTRRVALWGLPEDEPLEAVRRELSRRAVPYLMLNQRNAHQLEMDLDTARGVSGGLRLGGQRVELEEVGAIFARPHDIREILSSEGDAPGTQSHRKAIALERKLFVWTEISPVLVVNRPSAVASNGSKPHQAELIRGQGFEIPPTLVTTSPDAVREFIVEHEQVIYKSVSGQRSIVSRVDGRHLEQIDDVANCPTQFQAHIPGIDWRVHIVGDAVYACEIRSQADDYRLAHVQGEAIEFNPASLPPAVAKCCRNLAGQLNLALAGIDLRRTYEDEWYCFEVNTTPAFTYFEQATGQPVTAAVAQLLIDACRGEAA